MSLSKHPIATLPFLALAAGLLLGLAAPAAAAPLGSYTTKEAATGSYSLRTLTRSKTTIPTKRVQKAPSARYVELAKPIAVELPPCDPYAAPSFDLSQPLTIGGEPCGPGSTLEGQYGQAGGDPSPPADTEERAYDRFHPFNNGLNPLRSYLMAVAAFYIYQPIDYTGSDFPGHFESTMQTYGLKADYFEDPATDTEAAVMSNDSIIILTFRGTTPGTDMKTDLRQHFRQMPPSWGEGVLVHTGFADSWKGIRKKVLDALDDHHVKNRRLWITGHSLGGAIATLAAYDLAQIEGIEVEGIRTFGQPRVGDEAFQKAFEQADLDSIFHRWQMEGDPVPTFFDDGWMPGCDVEIDIFALEFGIDCQISPLYHHVGLVIDVLVEGTTSSPVYILDPYVDDHELDWYAGGAEIEHVKYDDALWQWLSASEDEGTMAILPPVALDPTPSGFLP